jgi:hypothetical protein
MTFPLDCDAAGITLRWKREVTDDDKLIACATTASTPWCGCCWPMKWA